jgi:hypothetical protein
LHYAITSYSQKDGIMEKITIALCNTHLQTIQKTGNCKNIFACVNEFQKDGIYGLTKRWGNGILIIAIAKKNISQKDGIMEKIIIAINCIMQNYPKDG